MLTDEADNADGNGPRRTTSPGSHPANCDDSVPNGPGAAADTDIWLVLSDGVILDVSGSRTEADSFVDMLNGVNQAIGRVTFIEVVDGSYLTH